MPAHSFLDGCTELNLEQETKDIPKILPRVQSRGFTSRPQQHVHQLPAGPLHHSSPAPSCGGLKAPCNLKPIHTPHTSQMEARPQITAQHTERSSLLKDPGSAHWKINWSSASEGLVYKGNSRDGGMETIQWQGSLTPHNSELIFSPQQGAGDGNRSLFTHGGPLKGPCSSTLGAAGES